MADGTEVPETKPTMSYAEWLAEGTRRFGAKFEDWRFECPICKNVAAIGDYRQYKDQGATMDSATNECIGRYSGQGRDAFGDKKEPKQPCDYALYGLFRLPGMIVTLEDGSQKFSFAFAEAK